MISYEQAMRNAVEAVDRGWAASNWIAIAAEIRQLATSDMTRVQVQRMLFSSETPAYVHRLLDAYVNDAPIDLAGVAAPQDVQERLDRELAKEWRTEERLVEPAPDTGEQLVNLSAYVERVNAAEADIADAQRPECETCGGALRVEVEQHETTTEREFMEGKRSFMPGMRTYVHVVPPLQDGHLAVPRKTPRPGDVGGETTAIIPAVRVNGMVEDARTEVLKLDGNRRCMHPQCGATIRQSAEGGVDWVHVRSGQRVCAAPDSRGRHTFAWPTAETTSEG
jgi:hypothetical protein